MTNQYELVCTLPKYLDPVINNPELAVAKIVAGTEHVYEVEDE